MRDVSPVLIVYSCIGSNTRPRHTLNGSVYTTVKLVFRSAPAEVGLSTVKTSASLALTSVTDTWLPGTSACQHHKRLLAQPTVVPVMPGCRTLSFRLCSPDI